MNEHYSSNINRTLIQSDRVFNTHDFCNTISKLNALSNVRITETINFKTFDVLNIQIT